MLIPVLLFVVGLLLPIKGGDRSVGGNFTCQSG